MAKNKDDLKSLSQIFRDEISFVVPDYQRGYSWSKDKQLEDLWEDLENMPENSHHYTGMFTFCKDDEDDNKYIIVDGQQRMTTLIILINELLKRIDGGIPNGSTVEEYKKKYLYKKPYGAIYTVYKFYYSKDAPSDIFFKMKILEQPCTEAIPTNTLYTHNLLDAKEYFAEKIKDYTQEQLIALFKKVTERLKFNEYLIEDDNEVYVTFETMNNRGKELSTLELLKNRLIYLSTLYSFLQPDNQTCAKNAEELRKSINNVWKTIYQYLGKSTKKKLNDDSFLRDHWIMYFRYDRKTSMVFKDDLLSKTFTAKRLLSNQLTIEEINRYVMSLQTSIVNWFNINCPIESELDETEKTWLTRLNRVGIGSFKPLLMAAYCKKDDSKMVKLLKACERFRFLTFAVSGRRSNTADYHFYTLAHDFYEQQKLFEVLIDEINGQTNYWLDINSFIISAVDRYQKREGFYSWSGLRYFLYEYERHIQEGTMDKDQKVNWETFENNQANKISIEHIYPQSPTDNYWTTRFVSDKDKNLTHSLGNLLLLSIAKNSEQQNYSFDKKKETTRNERGEITHHGYDTGSYSEIEVSKNNEWLPNSIIERGRALISFLNTHWEINHVFTDEEINKLLNISEDQPTLEIDHVSDQPDWVEESSEEQL